MVCELLLHNNVYVKKQNTVAHPTHFTPIFQTNIAPSPEASIYPLFGIPPTLNTRLGQRSLSLLTNTLPHPLSATVPWKGAGGRCGQPSRPRHSPSKVAQAPSGRKGPSPPSRRSSPADGRVRVSANPLGRGAGGPAGLPGPLRWGRRHSPPVSAGGQIRFQLHGHTSGGTGDRKKPPSPPQPGWRTPTQASMFPRLCGSGSSSSSAPARLPPRQRPCGGREAGREEGSGRERGWGPNCRARAGRRSRGARRADFWEM